VARQRKGSFPRGVFFKGERRNARNDGKCCWQERNIQGEDGTAKRISKHAEQKGGGDPVRVGTLQEIEAGDWLRGSSQQLRRKVCRALGGSYRKNGLGVPAGLGSAR